MTPSIHNAVVAVVLVAFGVWLAVRILNRRETWAKRTGVILLVLLLGYPLSLGPACWISSRIRWGNQIVSWIYRPLAPEREWWMKEEPLLHRVIDWYSELGAAKGWGWYQPSWRGHGQPPPAMKWDRWGGPL